MDVQWNVLLSLKYWGTTQRAPEAVCVSETQVVEPGKCILFDLMVNNDVIFIISDGNCCQMYKLGFYDDTRIVWEMSWYETMLDLIIVI